MIVGPLLRDLGRTLPTQGIETTWSKMGALQQQAEPVVAQAAMGGTPSPYPQNAGSTGEDILSLVTVCDPSEGGAHVAALQVGGVR